MPKQSGRARKICSQFFTLAAVGLYISIYTLRK